MGTKIGRNDPCPCDSGKKYKRCHSGVPAGEIPQKSTSPPTNDVMGAQELSDIILASREPVADLLQASFGVPVLDQSDSSFFNKYHVFLGAHQNTFRRCYLGLLGEDEETQRGILGVIKETAILMMTYDAQFRTTHPHTMARILENISCLEEFLRRKGLYHEYDLLRFLGNNPLTSETAVAMATSKLTGKDSMLPVADMTKHTHEGMADYRQRLYSVLGPENIRDPLVVGVMAGGIYNAATLYVASILSGLNPDFALVKKSRHERNVSVFPPEGKNIRSALEEGRDVIVVDDFVFGFQTFFSIFDYFGRPQNMRFSALFYNSPLPKELTILERRILHYLTENPHKLPFADGGLRSTITTLSQYGGGLERDSRHTAVMRPTF